MTEHDVPTMGAQDSPDAIYDARVLGKPRMVLFGFQHMFAMFGATILVPVLTGLSVQATLLFAGLGTLLFHFLSRGKIPAFLGSSFAFIAGYAAIAPNGETELLPYACLGVACAGTLYFILSALFKAFGAVRVMRFFPAVVTGPIVISIGLILASSAIANCSTNWAVAVIAITTIIVVNIWGRGMIKIIPILMGVIVSYITAAILGEVDFSGVAAAPWIGAPIIWDNTVFGLIGPQFDSGLAITAIITIMPIALATMIEHIGDVAALIFYFLPSKRLHYADILPGSLFTSAGLIVVSFAFNLYVSISTDYDLLYGSFANAVAIIIWFWAIGWVLLIGIVFNRVWWSVRPRNKKPIPQYVIDRRNPVGFF